MRLFLSAAVGIAAAAAPHAVFAQSAQETIDRCRATAGDAERIACLEAALIEDDNDGLRIPLPFGGGGDADAPAAQAAAPATAAEQMGAEQVAIRDGTFDDDIDADGDGEDDDGLRMEAVITRMETDPRNMLVVQLDNGQVWRQTQTESFPVRIDLDQPQPVAITTSGFGGYRMLIITLDRRIRVERVR